MQKKKLFSLSNIFLPTSVGQIIYETLIRKHYITHVSTICEISKSYLSCAFFLLKFARLSLSHRAFPEVTGKTNDAELISFLFHLCTKSF